MGVINRHGPAPVNLSPPAPVYPDELRRRIDAGEWVVDLRNRTAFAAGHLDGTLAFELSTSFVTYLGWLYTWGAPLTLIGEDHDQIAAAQRELVRIGVDNVTGSAVGDVSRLANGTPLRSYRVADFGDLAAAMAAWTTSPCSTSANGASTTTATSPEPSTSRCTNSPTGLRGPRGRSVGALRVGLPRLHRRVHAGPRRPHHRAHRRHVWPSRETRTCRLDPGLVRTWRSASGRDPNYCGRPPSRSRQRRQHQVGQPHP